MITAAILIKLTADTPGLTLDQNAFWEEAPLQRDGTPAEGVWLVTRGGNQTTARGTNQLTTMDFYVAFKNKTKTEKTIESISEWIRTNKTICELSGAVGDSRYNFTNIRIRPATTPTNYGATENGLIVKMASAQVYYDINQ